MGLGDWRAQRRMRDPVRGVFRVTGWYVKHPSSNPPGTITGVLLAPGIPATPAEHRADLRGRWVAQRELPVLIDRSEPSRFAVLWSEVTKVSRADREHRIAEAEAEQFNAEDHY